MICLLKATVLTVEATSVVSVNWLVWSLLIIFMLVIKMIISYFKLNKSESKGDAADFDAEELRKMFKDEID